MCQFNNSAFVIFGEFEVIINNYSQSLLLAAGRHCVFSCGCWSRYCFPTDVVLPFPGGTRFALPLFLSLNHFGWLPPQGWQNVVAVGINYYLPSSRVVFAQ